MALTLPDRMSGSEVFSYFRHRPEQTLFYQLIERHWPEFQSHLSETGSYLPRHVTREFDEYLECGRLEHGFLRAHCEICRHEHLVVFSCKRRGFCPRIWITFPWAAMEDVTGLLLRVGAEPQSEVEMLETLECEYAIQVPPAAKCGSLERHKSITP